MTSTILAPARPDVRVQLTGVLDDRAALRLRAEARELPPGSHLVVDLRSCTFIDAVGLGALVGCIRRADAAGATVSLVSEPGSPAEQVLLSTGVAGLLRRMERR